MLICIFGLAHTDKVELVTAPGISEEHIAESAPMVRALVVARLETMWRVCEPHIDGGAGKPDPRFIEAGIRIVDRLARLYRLDAPQVSGNDQDSGSRVLDREAAAGMLRELEQKVKDRFE